MLKIGTQWKTEQEKQEFSRPVLIKKRTLLFTTINYISRTDLALPHASYFNSMPKPAEYTASHTHPALNNTFLLGHIIKMCNELVQSLTRISLPTNGRWRNFAARSISSTLQLRCLTMETNNRIKCGFDNAYRLRLSIESNAEVQNRTNGAVSLWTIKSNKTEFSGENEFNIRRTYEAHAGGIGISSINSYTYVKWTKVESDTPRNQPLK